VSRKRHRRQGLIFGLLFLVAAGYALHMGVDYPLKRFESMEADMEGRSRYAKKTVDIFKDYPVAGAGVGNFQYAYPKYQAAEDKGRFFLYAHSDWAQFLAEAGITGLLILLAGTAYYFYRTLKLWNARSDPFAVCLGICPIAVMLALVVHSVGDFNLHIPANFLMLSAITAIGYSALHLERRRNRETSFSSHFILPLKTRGAFALVIMGCLILWSGSWSLRHLAAETHCSTVINSTLKREASPPLDNIERALFWDPQNAEYAHKKALELMHIRDNKMRPRAEAAWIAEQKHIVHAVERAVQLNPLDAEYHIRLAWQLAYLSAEPDAGEYWLAAADLSMDRAGYFVGSRDPRHYLRMGHYWVRRSKMILMPASRWDDMWARACSYYIKAQQLDDSRPLKEEIRDFVWNHYPDEKMIQDALID
jgi:hypothetical protein